MELQAIRTFIDVVRQGSFAAAARLRDIDPSSVSRTISSLEAELGFPLLQRTTRKLSLTEAGAAYHARVEPLIDDLRRAGEEARDLVSAPTGTLRVTACTSFGERVLAPLLPTFRRAYPDLVIELLLADHHVDLLEDQIDIAIRFGSRPHGDFAVTMLTPRTFRVCASPSLIRMHGRPATPDQLSAMDCLLFSTPGYRNVWRFRDRRGDVAEIPVSGHLRISHGLTMTECTVAGMGPALLPDWLCQAEVESGALIDLFPDYQCTATSFDTAAWLIYPRRHYRALKVDAFIEHLRRHFQRGAFMP